MFIYHKDFTHFWGYQWEIQLHSYALIIGTLRTEFADKLTLKILV